MGQLGPAEVSSHKSRTLVSIFKNGTSFSQESWDESNKMMKPQKIYWPWGLGLRNYIWVTWAQKTYPTISPEPWLQFLQTGPHFLKNCEMNPVKPWTLQKIYWPWGLGPKNYTRPTWAQQTYQAINPES